jgi:alkanesulfonate monooxygenase SsuD/methylene tetrahydromethanopterin reductase-like flavin-dependent oxidoreductase (luciferase family)
MKFGLFYQLPCAPEQDEVTRYNDTMEQIVCADALGFDVAWLAELHFYRAFSIMPAPLIVAAVLAQRTRRIRLGLAVALLPLQHPLRTAEEAATVDLLSQGRLELGVGRGTIAIHFQGLNVPRDESRVRFEEALTILERAWTQEICTFDGTYYHVPPTRVVPRPVQKPYPPLRIAANSTDSAIFAGTRGYPVFLASPINPLHKLPEHIHLYRQAFRDTGHRDKRPDVATLFFTQVADSAAQARQQVEPSTMHYFRTITQQARLGEGDPAVSYAYLQEVRQRQESLTWNDIDAGMGVYGSPSACIQKIKEIHKLCGMDQLICWFNPGGLVPHQQVLANMRRFAEDVMPAVRELE